MQKEFNHPTAPLFQEVSHLDIGEQKNENLTQEYYSQIFFEPDSPVIRYLKPKNFE